MTKSAPRPFSYYFLRIRRRKPKHSVPGASTHAVDATGGALPEARVLVRHVGTGLERAMIEELSVGADFVFARTTGSQRRTNRYLSPPYDFDPCGRGLYDRSDRLDPRYGSFDVVESTTRRRYTAFILSAEKRFSRGFQFQLYFTLSQNKTDDDNERGSNGYGNSHAENLDADWAESILDVRHRFVANAVSELPGGFPLGALVVANTGTPFSVLTGTDDNGDGNFTHRAVVDESTVLPCRRPASTSTTVFSHTTVPGSQAFSTLTRAWPRVSTSEPWGAWS